MPRSLLRGTGERSVAPGAYTDPSGASDTGSRRLPERFNTFTNRDVDADETSLPDPDAAGHDHVGCVENVVLNNRMMPDVIAAPERHVGSDFGKGLNRVVFEETPKHHQPAWKTFCDVARMRWCGSCRS